MNAGIVPIKRLDQAKRRLAGALTRDAHVSLVGALVDDVFDLCGAVPELDWWIGSDDDSVLAEAGGRGFRTCRDEGAGLNEALAAAIAAASAAGATSVTIVPADLPVATATDIIDVLDTGATSDVVVVPDEGKGGTNALYLSPPKAIPTRFGDASLAAHMKEAEAVKARCALLPLPRLALDLDTIDDVVALKASGFDGGRTMELLRGLD